MFGHWLRSKQKAAPCAAFLPSKKYDRPAQTGEIKTMDGRSATTERWSAWTVRFISDAME